MKKILSIALVGAFAVPALAQNPAGIVADNSGKTIKLNDDRQTPADVVYDTLKYVDTQNYGAGNGNAISGRAIFGTVFDLGLADDFELDGDYTMTSAVEDSVTFFGATPADGVLVEFFDDLGGFPAESPSACYLATGGEVSNTGFSDTIFGLLGVRLAADVSGGGIVLGAGTHWASIVPVDDSSGGDWYYAVRNTSEVLGADSHGRDGGGDHGTDCSAGYGGYSGGYGTSDWTSFGAIGFGAGTVSRQLSGDLGGTPRLRLTGPSARIAGRVNSWTVERCTPGSRVGLTYSLAGEGSGSLLGCPLDIISPKLGTFTVAGSDTVTLSANVPLAAQGLTTYEQAASDDDAPCRVSNVTSGEWL